MGPNPSLRPDCGIIHEYSLRHRRCEFSFPLVLCNWPYDQSQGRIYECPFRIHPVDVQTDY